MKLEVVERKVRQIWQDVCSEPLSSPNEVLAYLETLGIASADREIFIVLHLDTRNRVVAHETTSMGSQNASLVHPREVFKAAIPEGSHQHHSGAQPPLRRSGPLQGRHRSHPPSGRGRRPDGD